ncbi:MAG: prephenate dehydrogenase dimerization domain-containing protein [Gammaproteobacteria bacterium]|nr:prephenate dehydrogenase dimerization domain-containing protein [Gammaproteobacteria bacterium]
MLAYALVDCLAGMNEHEDIFRFAAGGFADFTRIASSSPRMWHDICFANREELLTAMERFQVELQALTDAIREDDRAAVIEMFTRAKTARDRFSDLRLAGKTVGGRDGDTSE